MPASLQRTTLLPSSQENGDRRPNELEATANAAALPSPHLFSTTGAQRNVSGGSARTPERQDDSAHAKLAHSPRNPVDSSPSLSPAAKSHHAFSTTDSSPSPQHSPKTNAATNNNQQIQSNKSRGTTVDKKHSSNSCTLTSDEEINIKNARQSNCTSSASTSDNNSASG